MVRQVSDTSILRTHDVGWFLNYPGHHSHAESWVRIETILLLRFSVRSEEGLLSSLLVRLCHQSDSYCDHSLKRRRPDNNKRSYGSIEVNSDRTPFA